MSRSMLTSSTFAATIALVGGLTIGTNAQAANDYVLMCNPGQQMQAVAGQRVSTQEAFATLTFRPASTGAAARAPRSGECAWSDRGFRPGEPNKLMFRDNGKWVQSLCSSRGCTFRTNSRGIQTMMNAVKGGRPFVVRAYNDRRGNMVITRFGP
ncbi:hypothetical protein [Cohaesibacter intestini]|uniref:hypothetical protein n=1 Tax=Cohaesibacter intestini TaxID=2211145 RepID=UPI000DEA2B19|nr:hypothetical protein [Cohaesibacter intestini]